MSSFTDLPSDCGTGCTRYKSGATTIASAPIDDDAATTTTNEAKDHNQPVIYIGEDTRINGRYDEIGAHDRLDLLHEIGHAFGLADTHGTTQGTPQGEQPRSIMARNRIFVRGDISLLLSNDDKVGVQWLYEHHRNGINATNCHFDEYQHSTTDKCVPQRSLIAALKQGQPAVAIDIINNYASLNVNDNEDGTGKAALHYAILNYADVNVSPANKADYLRVIDALLNYAGI